MNIKGKVILKTELTTVGANSMEKIMLGIEEVDTQYPNSIVVTFLKDKALMANSYQLNDVIDVQINAKIKEYEGKSYNSINGRSIKLISKGSNQAIVRDDETDIPY